MVLLLLLEECLLSMSRERILPTLETYTRLLLSLEVPSSI